MRTEVIEKEDDTVLVKEASDEKKNYVIADSVKTQKLIADQLHIIKWIFVIVAIGLFLIGVGGLMLYVKLDALNIMSRILSV